MGHRMLSLVFTLAFLFLAGEVAEGFLGQYHHAGLPLVPRIQHQGFPSLVSTDAAEFTKKRRPNSVSFMQNRSGDLLQGDRFLQIACNETALPESCILTIGERRYNVTSWAKAHPGGAELLQRFHDKNATAAFLSAGHSRHAVELLETFAIDGPDNTTSSALLGIKQPEVMVKWKRKLITREDPRWIHKTLGLYSLVHFLYRISIMLVGSDLAAGFGKGSKAWVLASLIPHALLSSSSLIFDTVPRERVVGKPMIWNENRWHSILFGMRSIVCTVLAWSSVRLHHAQPWRSGMVATTCVSILATLWGADVVSNRLGPLKEQSSSVATLPFWEDCSVDVQRSVKHFYAFSQFAATLTCLLAANPAWPFLILFPIQFASFLLTLCRKGLLSAKGWHILYTASLALPMVASIRVIMHLQSAAFITGFFTISLILFRLRCLGLNKYVLWLPVLMARFLIGDQYIPYQMW